MTRELAKFQQRIFSYKERSRSSPYHHPCLKGSRHNGKNCLLEIFLSSTVTVADYRTFTRARDKEKIADCIYQRFQERYLVPLKASEAGDGLAMMACGCLMVEAMQAFWDGSAKSGLSAPPFLNFLDRVNQFAPLQEHGRLFYKHVRSGIMHHGEATGGWQIQKMLFNYSTPRPWWSIPPNS